MSVIFLHPELQAYNRCRAPAGGKAVVLLCEGKGPATGAPDSKKARSMLDRALEKSRGLLGDNRFGAAPRPYRQAL